MNFVKVGDAIINLDLVAEARLTRERWRHGKKWEVAELRLYGAGNDAFAEFEGDQAVQLFAFLSGLCSTTFGPDGALYLEGDLPPAREEPR